MDKNTISRTLSPLATSHNSLAGHWQLLFFLWQETHILYQVMFTVKDRLVLAHKSRSGTFPAARDRNEWQKDMGIP